MKTNFRKSEKKEIEEDKTNNENKDLTKEEFEEFIHKSGAKGSFMVYRSTKKDEELGIDEL
jgi:hypothetical protein|tara:strand:- start:3417 stop:3599 length:183 start_codon:yes stop_codon:yes gene_type:complete